MHIPTNQGSNGITGNTSITALVDAARTARVLPHVQQAFNKAAVVMGLTDAGNLTGVLQNTRTAVETYSVEAPQTNKVTPGSIEDLTNAYNLFIARGNVQPLIEIGNYARAHPDEIPRISQAYTDVWGEKLSDLLGPKLADILLGQIAEANDGSAGSATKLREIGADILGYNMAARAAADPEGAARSAAARRAVAIAAAAVAGN